MAIRFAILVVLFSGWGQPVSAQRFRLGIRAMPQLNSIWNAEDRDSDLLIPQPSSGLAIGVAVNYLVQPTWEVEFNALFSTQRHQYQLRDTTGARLFRRYDLILNYIKFPVLLKYRLSLDSKTALGVYAGPQLSLLSGAEERISDSLIIDYSGTGITASNKYTSLDIAAVVGAELQFAINSKLLLYTGIRVEYGFFDVEDKKAIWAPGGFVETPYYDSYYGPQIFRETPRTEKSNLFVIGATVGVSYILNTTRNPNDYYW